MLWDNTLKGYCNCPGFHKPDHNSFFYGIVYLRRKPVPVWVPMRTGESQDCITMICCWPPCVLVSLRLIVRRCSSFDGLINSLVFWLSSLSLGLSSNGTHSLEYKVPYRNRPGRTEIWSSCNGGRFPECCSKRDSMEETGSLVFTMSVWICCNLGGLPLGKCKRSRWREGEDECWYHFLRHERSNQFEKKQLRKISSLLRRCRYSWKRKEKAKK